MVDRDIETRVALLEERFSRYADRDWVRELLAPTQLAVNEIKNSINAVTSKMEFLADQVSTVFAAHNTFLEEKRLAEKQAAKENTPMGIIRKYAPAVAVLVGLVSLFRVLGTGLELWLLHSPVK